MLIYRSPDINESKIDCVRRQGLREGDHRQYLRGCLTKRNAPMNHNLQDSDLSTALVRAETMRAFGRLSAQQINWTPRAGEWSMGSVDDRQLLERL